MSAPIRREFTGGEQENAFAAAVDEAARAAGLVLKLWLTDLAPDDQQRIGLLMQGGVRMGVQFVLRGVDMPPDVELVAKDSQGGVVKLAWLDLKIPTFQ